MREGPASGRGGGSRDGPASGCGRDHAGTTTSDFGSTVANVIGGSAEVFASTCERLFRSLSSCSRSFTWLCSFVSAASALRYDFFASQRESFSSLIYACRSLSWP